MQVNWQDYIISDKDILLGKPTIKDTRLSIDHILGLLPQGWTETTILENYPSLTKEHMQAVFAYIHDCMKEGLFFSNVRRSA
jgi:uncharacterized protein (DUF433 family)